MSVDLHQDLRGAFHAPAAAVPDAAEVWRRGRRARRRRQAAQTVGVATVLVAVLAGVLQVARPAGLEVANAPAAPAGELGGWDLLAPGTFTYDQIDARLSAGDPVLQLGSVGAAAFDVTPDGTIAAFVAGTGMLTVQATDGGRRQIDASFLLDMFPPQGSIHRLRIGPDRRLYLTSLDPDAARDGHRLTVFDQRGDLLGTKVTPRSHQPVLFGQERVWLRTDDGWAAVATIGGPLTVGGSRAVRAPDIPEVTWIEDQGSILHQIAGGSFVGERYTLEQDGRTMHWTGPVDGVVGWASGPAREDQAAPVLVQHDTRAPLVLVPTPDGLLAAWADPAADGLSGIGDSAAVVASLPGAEHPGGQRTPTLYWLQEVDGQLAIVRSSP